ncbi:MAG: DUF2085 domain-containing protein [Candidatus Altiarchaeales archaeon]|nr:DUF2085 domain-containing protein [Candidatus Altiarchaeales archaeon]MBD3416785.1 DUF2085 domain-containing protein [Candidatus Altiarchaeales archaeon]
MRAFYFLFLTACAFVLLLIFAAPYLAITGHENISELIHVMFGESCHQLPERSFFVYGEKMPVCARCFGIYAGLFTGTLLYPVCGREGVPDSRLLLAALAPLALDGITQLTGLRESNNLLRLGTGLIFGAIIPYYIIPALEPLLKGFKGFINRR